MAGSQQIVLFFVFNKLYVLLAFSLSGKDGKENWASFITKLSNAGQKQQKKKGTLSDQLFVLEPELYLNSYSVV